MTPHTDDVVIRQKRGNPSTVFLLGTPAAPDQFILRTRDEAVSQGPCVCETAARARMVCEGRR